MHTLNPYPIPKPNPNLILTLNPNPDPSLSLSPSLVRSPSPFRDHFIFVLMVRIRNSLRHYRAPGFSVTIVGLLVALVQTVMINKLISN